MADADEDVIPLAGTSGGDEIDLSDETQDFRFLAALGNNGGKIPKRGEKDFEPHATALQSNTLAASRQAMHNALSIERVHHPKGYTIATYHPESNMAYAQNPRGVWVSKIGQVLPPGHDPLGNDELRGQRVWLLPEEALYLLERGTIDIRWPASEFEAMAGQLGLPMSLQAAYAIFIGDEASHNNALSLERYSVYTALKRSGYTVIRAPTWNGAGPALDRHHFPAPEKRSWRVGLSLFTTWQSKFFTFGDSYYERQREASALIEPGLYRSYIDIYRRLSLVLSFDPTTRQYPDDPYIPQTDEHFRVTHYVYKPNSATFKKTAPGTPDFRLAVINARETRMPTLQQLGALLETVPYSPPYESASLYAKLKNGYKSVVLAVVDQGVTSYLRIADSAFGKEKLFERMGTGAGNKRGGGRGGRGGRGGHNSRGRG